MDLPLRALHRFRRAVAGRDVDSGTDGLAAVYGLNGGHGRRRLHSGAVRLLFILLRLTESSLCEELRCSCRRRELDLAHRSL